MKCAVTVTYGKLPDEEIRAYYFHGCNKYGREPKSMDIKVCGDEVEIRYGFEPVPFQRLRRITGYLVGDMSRWNNGKRAEEHDRVRHGVDADE